MQNRSRSELYQNFIEFIANDVQRERHLTNRRMLSVFFWCFFLPALISVTILLLVKFGILPKSTRNYLDWLVLILPIIYSLYFLSSEVITQVPRALRKGGMASTLAQSLKEGEWRERVCEGMKKDVSATAEEWSWMIASFKMDLQAMEYRTKYLTALAGAVFFLLMQGIDSISDEGSKVTWVKSSIFGWVETSSNDFTQFVGLALFLVLLYLSGSQTSQSLKRYLNCAELVKLRARD